MGTIRNYLALCRPTQWLKNLLLFLPLIFSGALLSSAKLSLSFQGFILLCILFSGIYAINDVVDVRYDRAHAGKKHRPVAAGQISTRAAVVFGAALFVFALLGSYALSLRFFGVVVAMLLFSLTYTYFVKNIVLLDLIWIAINYVLRALAGSELIGVTASSWLILGTFFFALFVITGKRYGEFVVGEKGKFDRKTLNAYTKDFLFATSLITLTLLVLCFALFSASAHGGVLLWTFPIFLYICLRYLYLVHTDARLAQKPEFFYTDTPLLVAGFALALATIILLYVL